jgi:hypothetical protein
MQFQSIERFNLEQTNTSPQRLMSSADVLLSSQEISGLNAGIFRASARE